MMDERWQGLCLAGVFALVAQGAQAQQFTMKISAPTANDVSTEYMAMMKKGIESRTGGKIKVELYPANQLGQIPATVEGVALGTIEMTLPAAGFLVGLDPRFEVLDIPGIFDNVQHGMQVLTDPEVRRRIASFGAAKGIESMVTFVHGPMMLVANRPVRAIGDFKALKIRAPGGSPMQMDPLKRLGASPLSMPLGEVLPALQNRAIDGSEAAFGVFTAFKYFDVAKNLTYLPSTYLVVGGATSRTWLKSLGPDLEAVVRDESRKAEAVFSTWGVEDLDRIAKTWQKNGGTLITMAPAEAKRYVEEVSAAVSPLLAARPQIKQDYDALVAAAKKHRK
jgi:TRAP-type transport system periplasmic protein